MGQVRRLKSWHPADVKAALEKRGLTLGEVARRNGLAPSTLRNALKTRCHAGEVAIAGALDLYPHNIWPDRYDDEGRPLHKRIRRALLNGSRAEVQRNSTQEVLT